RSVLRLDRIRRTRTPRWAASRRASRVGWSGTKYAFVTSIDLLAAEVATRKERRAGFRWAPGIESITWHVIVPARSAEKSERAVSSSAVASAQALAKATCSWRTTGPS